MTTIEELAGLKRKYDDAWLEVVHASQVFAVIAAAYQKVKCDAIIEQEAILAQAREAENALKAKARPKAQRPPTRR